MRQQQREISSVKKIVEQEVVSAREIYIDSLVSDRKVTRQRMLGALFEMNSTYRNSPAGSGAVAASKAAKYAKYRNLDI